MPDRRAMVFIDGQNLYYGAREFFDGDNPIDYVELVEYLSGDAFLVRPYLFASHPEDSKPYD